MNKQGFTLVELLVTIVVLGIVMVIAVPAIGAVNSSIKNNMLEKKTKMIEEAAVLMAQDIKGSIISSNLKYNGNTCKSFIVSNLVPNYLDKDNDNACLKNDSTDIVGCIVDPSDEDNYLDKYEVIVYFKNKRMYAIVDTDNTLECK